MKKTLLFLLISALALAACGGGESEPVAETPEAAPETAAPDEPAADAEEAAPEAAPETEEVTPEAAAVSSGDYPFAEHRLLNPVCETQSFPSGMTPSDTGTRSVVFSQDEVGEPYEFESNALGSSGDFTRSSTTSNEIDLVVCLAPTGEEAFSVPCETDGTEYNLVGDLLAVTVYDLQTQEVVLTDTVPQSMDCPSFAIIRDGVVKPIRTDIETLQAVLTPLS